MKSLNDGIYRKGTEGCKWPYEFSDGEEWWAFIRSIKEVFE